MSHNIPRREPLVVKIVIILFLTTTGLISMIVSSPLPPEWVQELIESKSGIRFPSTTEESPIVVYSATVFHPQKQPKPEKVPPTPYPYWKWKSPEYFGGGGDYKYKNKWRKPVGAGKKGKWNPYFNKFNPSVVDDNDSNSSE